MKDFANDIGPLNTSLIHRLIIEVDSFAGYFGQDVNNFRNSIHCIIRDSEDCLPKTCEVVVWPVVLVNREQYSGMEFDMFMRVVELDVRDIMGSLRKAIGRLKKAMRDEERQGVYQDLFWAKRLFREYLRVEIEALEHNVEEGQRAVIQTEDKLTAKTKTGDLRSEKAHQHA